MSFSVGLLPRTWKQCATASAQVVQQVAQKKTVAATTYEADEHEIWVPCQVGTNASDYIDERKPG